MKNNKEIQPGDIWNKDKAKGLENFIFTQSEKQSEQRVLKNKLLAIQYRLEDYIEKDTKGKKLLAIDFVKMYLDTLNITQRKLAELFEMKDSNLHKYLVGERKLNTDLVLKLSSFSHTDPEYWLRLEVKNELMEIKKEKKSSNRYKRYDYKNLLKAS